MERENISVDARDTLADIFMLREYASEQSTNVAKAMNILITNFDSDDRKKYMDALKELKDKKYIHIWPLPVYKEKSQIKFSFVSPRLDGKVYFFKFMDHEEKYEVKYRDEERILTKEIDKLCIKISKSGIYIIILAGISAITSIINTLLNIYNTFH